MEPEISKTQRAFSAHVLKVVTFCKSTFHIEEASTGSRDKLNYETSWQQDSPTMLFTSHKLQANPGAHITIASFDKTVCEHHAALIPLQMDFLEASKQML